MEFKMFCEKTAENIGLKFFGRLHDERHAGASVDANGNKTEYFIDFCDLSHGENKLFVAEIFENARKIYVGAISFEDYNGEKSFEHYETQVSPDGRYNDEFMPCDENGNEIDGQLWQFYCGNSLKRACKSFLKGGAMRNPNRKPIKVW